MKLEVMEMTREILEAALLGLEQQKEKVEELIEGIRSQLREQSGAEIETDRRRKTWSAKAEASGRIVASLEPRGRQVSAEGRERIAAAQKKRWAKVRREKKAKLKLRAERKAERKAEKAAARASAAAVTAPVVPVKKLRKVSLRPAPQKSRAKKAAAA